MIIIEHCFFLFHIWIHRIFYIFFYYQLGIKWRPNNFILKIPSSLNYLKLFSTMVHFSKDGKFDVLPIECTLLFWVICYSHRVLQSASNGHFWISKLSFFYINKFFGKTYINNVMTIAMKCQSAPSTLNDTFHIHSLLIIVHVIFWTPV